MQRPRVTGTQGHRDTEPRGCGDADTEAGDTKTQPRGGRGARRPALGRAATGARTQRARASGGHGGGGVRTPRPCTHVCAPPTRPCTAGADAARLLSAPFHARSAAELDNRFVTLGCNFPVWEALLRTARTGLGGCASASRPRPPLAGLRERVRRVPAGVRAPRRGADTGGRPSAQICSEELKAPARPLLQGPSWPDTQPWAPPRPRQVQTRPYDKPAALPGALGQPAHVTILRVDS